MEAAPHKGIKDQAGCTTLGVVPSAVFLAQYCKHLPMAVALPETTTVLQEDRGTLWESQIVQDMVQSALCMIVDKMLTWWHMWRCRYIVIAAGSSGRGVSPKATA